MITAVPVARPLGDNTVRDASAGLLLGALVLVGGVVYLAATAGAREADRAPTPPSRSKEPLPTSFAGFFGARGRRKRRRR